MALILHPDFLLYEKKDMPFCSSLQVAEEFGKEHKNVLADIRNLDCSDDFNALNFQPVKYTDDKGEKRPMFLMTKDGFMFLVFGYRGKKAAAIKEAYIRRFNEYEDYIKKYILARDDFPIFSQAVYDAHDEPKSYHFSNECDMINRIVLGMTAKQFKELHGLPANVKSIRPFLETQQAKAIRKLQTADVRLLYKGFEFQERKNELTGFFNNTLAIGG